jgi:hypothetical protein
MASLALNIVKHPTESTVSTPITVAGNRLYFIFHSPYLSSSIQRALKTESVFTPALVTLFKHKIRISAIHTRPVTPIEIIGITPPRPRFKDAQK